jgi:hypothetical protein
LNILVTRILDKAHLDFVTFLDAPGSADIRAARSIGQNWLEVFVRRAVHERQLRAGHVDAHFAFAGGGEPKFIS